MKYYCNPLNISYKYQFNKSTDGRIIASREAADPSMIMFNEKYYIFPSMTCGFLHSEDMVQWEFHPLKNIPVYDYAPDVRVVGDYIYFCASNHEEGCFYRTKNPFADDFEPIKSQFPFWDPNLFADDDGKIYFYWGSSTTKPLYGIELNPNDLTPIGQKVELMNSDVDNIGYERSGENHIPERSKEEIDEIMKNFHETSKGMPSEMKEAALSFIMCKPYIEGVWMTKHHNKYYLQYASPSSRNNVYADGVYISESPLGPFTLAENNPYSYKPGGFISGAGHGSTMEDSFNNLWHIATMRIAKNHNFERRIGLWPSGWDNEGEMFCNQRFGDWPIKVEQAANDPWASPEWMLLSHKKQAFASSSTMDKLPCNVTDENVQTWWKANSNKLSEWLKVDLGKAYDVRAIQINFADDELMPQMPTGASLNTALLQERWIDEVSQKTQWLLEGSEDDINYFVIEDKSSASTDLPHDLVVKENGINARYIRLSSIALPYEQNPCVSGLRVFGIGTDDKPAQATDVVAVKKGPLDMDVSWSGNAMGYVVLWGHKADKLYHSYQVFNENVTIGGLVKGQDIYIRVDSFNESGITIGNTFKAT